MSSTLTGAREVIYIYGVTPLACYFSREPFKRKEPILYNYYPGNNNILYLLYNQIETRGEKMLKLKIPKLIEPGIVHIDQNLAGRWGEASGTKGIPFQTIISAMSASTSSKAHRPYGMD